MAKKEPPRPVPEIPTLSDDVLEALHRDFGFPPGFSIHFMGGHLELAANLYWFYIPPATASQKAKDLRRIEKLTNQLLDALDGDGVLFLDVEPPGIRRPLYEMRDKAAQMAERCKQMPPERGRRSEHDLHGFVRQVQFVYFHGTGRTHRYTWSDEAKRYQGGLLKFVRAVADLYGIRDSDESIVSAIKLLARNGLLYEDSGG